MKYDAIAHLIDELRTIGCHDNGDARCTCVIGMDAADMIRKLSDTVDTLRLLEKSHRDKANAQFHRAEAAEARAVSAEATCAAWSEVSQRNYQRAKKAEQDNAYLQDKIMDEQRRRFTAEAAVNTARAALCAAQENEK